jgi:hypothetical protein
MNLREEILKEHSKAQCDKIVKWVGGSQERFDQLFALFTKGEYKVSQRAAWPVSYCIDGHPAFLKKHWGAFVRNLQKPGLHDAVKRNSVRLLQNIIIPEKWAGSIMDTCFRFVEKTDEAVAVKVFSLSVLDNLSAKHPEIIPEIKLLIENQRPHQTAAFISRVNNLLKKWEKRGF